MKLDTVIWIGVGGTGSIGIEPAARLLMHHPEGTWNIIINDLDIYEEKNATRQFFDPEHIGMNKAEATAQRLKALPNLIPESRRMEYGTMLEFIHKYHRNRRGTLVVVMCVDNDATRNEVIRALNDSELPNYVLINPGNSEWTCKISVEVKLNGEMKTLSLCDRFPNIANPEDQLPGGCGEAAVSAPQTIAANNLSATGVLQYLTALLHNHPIAPEMSGDVRKGKLIPNGSLIALQ